MPSIFPQPVTRATLPVSVELSSTVVVYLRELVVPGSQRPAGAHASTDSETWTTLSIRGNMPHTCARARGQHGFLNIIQFRKEARSTANAFDHGQARR